MWKRRACPLKRLYIIFHTHGRMGMATSTFQSLSLAETHFLHLPLVPSPCLCVPCESAWPTASLQHTTAPPFPCAAQPSHETRPRTTQHHGSSFPPSSCSLVSLQHGSTILHSASPLSRHLTQSHRTSRHCLLGCGCVFSSQKIFYINRHIEFPDTYIEH